MKTFTLTAIIPCYNFEKYIEQAVDSVLMQKTNFEFQIYLIDDCSTDKTFEIINKKYKDSPNVSIFQSSKNKGISRNMAETLNKVTTPYVFSIDGDDYLADQLYFQRAIDFLESNKNYSVYCTGYKWLHNDGSFDPPNSFFISNIEDVKLEDILNINHISIGRVFRNYKNIIKPWMDDSYHEDWLMNVELLKNGMARCERVLGAIYRITNSGRITSLTDEQKHAKNRKTINAIKAHLKSKTITIVDSFVHNENIKKKLENAIRWMGEDGHDILLVSNTIVDKEILNNVKFYLYDSRNQLFQEKYDGLGLVNLWKVLGEGFTVHDIVPTLQKHGLSVLVNLFNSLHYAKLQGYTHFQRFEVDDMFGEKSRKFILKVPEICEEEQKQGLFYYNETNDPPDISFHYFYCNIDLFLEKVVRILKEQDYVDYLKKYHDNKIFKIAEVFIYENLKRNGDSNILIKNGKDSMNLDFSDTTWNTETSISSFDSKYGKCTTRLYHVNEYNHKDGQYHRGDSFIVYTHSYHSGKTIRNIIVEKTNGEKYNLTHETATAHGWCWNEVSADTKSISVYENGKFLYKDLASDCISYINRKK